MKAIFLLLFIFTIVSTSFAKTVVISSSGYTFSPNDITVNIGDIVKFSLSSSHNAVEVSQQTYNSNGTISNGGFQLAFGGGNVTFTATGVYYYVCENHASMGMKGIIRVTSTTGLNEMLKNNQGFLKYYPMPFHDKLTIEITTKSTGNGNLEIMSTLGQIYYSRKYENESNFIETLDLSAIPSGVYLLLFQSGENRIVKKIIKN